MTKLEDGPSPEETSFPDGKLHQGGLLANHQAERQTTDVAAADLQLENSDFQKDTSTVGSNHPSPEKPKMAGSNHVGSLGLQAACSNATALDLLQLRKLPMTPKEAHISRAEPLSVSTDNQVYESIQDLDRLCVRGWPKQPDLPARATGCVTESADSGEKILGTLEQPGGVPLQQLMDVTPEDLSAIQPMSDMEKRLSTMYARVCKKPKAARPLQPADNDRLANQDEEEPPPIPEKQFEDLYEGLNVSPEMQEDSMPGVTTPPKAWTRVGKKQTLNQTTVPQSC